MNDLARREHLGLRVRLGRVELRVEDGDSETELWGAKRGVARRGVSCRGVAWVGMWVA